MGLLILQLAVSLGFIFICPLLATSCGLSVVAWHWIYLAVAFVLLVHRHPRSNESVVLLCGKVLEVTYDDGGNELERVSMDASAGIFGCVVPAGAWHTVEVLEPSVIMEVKDGRYGEDGSESFFNNR